MRSKIKKVFAIALVLSMMATMFSFAAGTRDTDIKLIDGNLVETVSFIDSDGVPVTMTRTTRPDNTYVLETYKNGAVVKDTGAIDYNVILSYVEPSKVRYQEVYLGTASVVTYIGPEYKTAADMARAISTRVKNVKLSVALELAASIFMVYANPVPIWIKKVTDTYEVHGDGGGFLGYYHMVDWLYAYDHSNTSGADYIANERADREGTTPGI